MTSVDPVRPLRLRIALASLALVLASGCSLVTAPHRAPLDGIYVNQALAGDTLVFRSDRTGERRRGWWADTEVGVRLSLSSFTYQPVRSELEITVTCPPNANCAPGPHYRARLDGDQLLLVPAHEESSEVAYRFRRIER